jgi:hypothetical protein
VAGVRTRNFRWWARLSALPGLGLLLGACWPGSETYFRPSAPGGMFISTCDKPDYGISFRSSAHDWILISLVPQSIDHDTFLAFKLSIGEDLRRLNSHADAAVAHISDPNARRHPKEQYVSKNRIDLLDIKVTGAVTVSWPPNHRKIFPVHYTYRSQFGTLLVPDFEGDTARIEMPKLFINGQEETFPTVTLTRATVSKMRGVNGNC